MENGKKYAYVKAAQAFLYDEGGEVVDEVLSGWAVEVLSGGPMVSVRTHYGYKGRIRQDCLAFADAQFLKDRDAGGRTLMVRRRSADLLSQPRAQGKVLQTLPAGALVTLTEQGRKQDGYAHVRAADGREGFISSALVFPRPDSDGLLYDDPDGTWLLHQKVLLSCGKDSARQAAVRASIADAAKTYLGTQYRWGGHSGQGTDCSGLALMSYMMNGILIYRDAKIVEGFPVRRIDPKDMKTGDLLYFPGHVAIYLGDGIYIHSTGHAGDFGVVFGSLVPGKPGYRQDLEGRCTAVGSVF